MYAKQPIKVKGNKSVNQIPEMPRQYCTPMQIYVYTEDIKMGNKNVRVMRTDSLGFKLTVRTDIQPDENQMIYYDAAGANLYMSEDGYFSLYINKDYELDSSYFAQNQ